MTIPKNILSLHAEEEALRVKSLEAIEQDENLLSHLSMIETSMDLIHYFIIHHNHENDEDQLTIQLLGIRLFNGASSALRLLLSGYYQGSALQLRDLLETVFLLGYFQTDRKLIAAWRKSDKKTRLKDFKPAKIREALGTRDGLTKEKRDKAYSLLCDLAGHPTYSGFRMLTPTPGGNANCGPFFAHTTMKATLEELTKELVQTGIVFTRFFDEKNSADEEIKNHFLGNFMKWGEKFYGKPPDLDTN
jgi:hypothetical protein